MTTEEMVTRVQTLLGNEAEVEASTIEEYISVATDDIVRTRYPFGIPEEYDISVYDGVICQLAARYIVRRGGLGEISHNENGINRAWYSSDDRDILSKVTPKAKAVR